MKGAVIASDATPDKNKLSTGTLTWSDIQNKAEYKSSSIGVNVNISPNAKYNEKGVTPNIGVTAEGNADSTTKSAISPGTIEVRSGNTDLSGLSRDPAGATNALDKIFDKKSVAEKQELAKLFGELAFEQVHKISKDNKWAEGSPQKIALHAFVGGIMAQLGGGNFASGAVGAGFNEAIQGELAKIKDPAVHQWASALVGAVASKVVGGDITTGASTAASGTKNNFLSDWQKEQRQKAVDEGDWKKVAYWDAIDKAQDQAMTQLGVYPGTDLNAPENHNLLQTVSKLGQEIEASPDFQNSFIEKLQTIDPSTLVTAGVVGTAVVVGGVTLYNLYGNWVKATPIVGSGGIAASAAQYQRLKDSLAIEEIQSVVATTEHGAIRLIQRGFTPQEISTLKLSPDKIMRQGDGAQVFIKNIGEGKYNVIVEGENGVVTALKNIGQNSLARLAKNYNWE